MRKDVEHFLRYAQRGGSLRGMIGRKWRHSGCWSRTTSAAQ